MYYVLIGWQEEDVETECGLVRVAIHGDRRRRALFTYHDLGTNCTFYTSLIHIDAYVPM